MVTPIAPAVFLAEVVPSPSASGSVASSPRSTRSVNEPRSETSDGPDVLRFLALAAGRDVELDALALVEAAVPVTLDRRVVHEDVVAPFDGDEAVALLGVEPLDRSGRCQVLLAPCGSRPMSASGWEGNRKVSGAVANRFGPERYEGRTVVSRSCRFRRDRS